MDYFDKKITELYNQPEQDIPTDLSWDQMEDGIYSRMDDTKPNRKVLWFWITAGLIAVTIIMGSVLKINDNNKDIKFATNSAPEKSNTQPSKLKYEVSIPSAQSPSDAANIKIDSDKNSTTTNQKTRSKKSNSLAHSIAKSKNKKSLTVQPNTLESKQAASINIAIMNRSLIAPSEEKEISNDVSILMQKSIADSKPISNSIAKSRDEINLKQIATPFSNTLNFQRKVPKSNYKNIIIDDTPRIIENERNTKYSFSLLGGTSLHSGFNIKTSDYTNALPGYSIKLGLSAEKENGWGYDIGIGHALLVEKFDIDITDTIAEHMKDIVVRQLTNTITGITTNVLGSADGNFSRTRKELIYNTINLISLDASIYKRINLSNRWSILPSMAIQYDRVLGIQGKSLDVANDVVLGTREVFTFDNNTAKINKNLFSAKFGIGIDYAVTHRLSLSVRTSSALSFTNFYENSHRLNSTYIQGGLTIRI